MPLSRNDFSVPKILKISDDEYFSIGKVSYFDNEKLVLSASTLKEIYKRDAYEVLIKENKAEISKELQYIFDVGSAFHCYILENDEFEKRYYIGEMKNDFNDVKRTFIHTEDFAFIKGAYENIKIKYPYMVEPSEWNEVTILTNINGVPYRAKLDKVVEVSDSLIEIIDLKSVFYDFYATKYKRDAESGIRWGLVKALQENNYDLQGVLYVKAVKSWLEHNGISKDVRFKLLLASKKTFDVKMVTFGSEMMQNGENKLNQVLPEIQAFFHSGMEQIAQDEII
jgi:hypothetical protein